MLDTNRSVCFTGHREVSHPDIGARLDVLVTQLINKGYRYFKAGGALGFDTEAAQSVLRLQKKYPHIKLILVLPYQSQSAKWTDEEKEVYENIKSRAEKVVYSSKGYKRGCFHIRNRMLVDESDVCVAYLVKCEGGAAYTVDYSHKKGLEVINIAKGAMYSESSQYAS